MILSHPFHHSLHEPMQVNKRDRLQSSTRRAMSFDLIGLLFWFVTALILLTAFPARAQVVKVSTYFERDSELKLEGSGYLYLDGSQIRVLTSEHIVIPSHAQSVYVVETADGVSAEAELVKSSWKSGLAILKLKLARNSPLRDETYDQLQELRQRPIPPELMNPQDGPWPRHTSIKQLAAYGFPAGTQSLKMHAVSGRLKVLPAGSVLHAVRVYSATGMATEFGMSGGPVMGGVPFGPYEFMGVITHATYTENSETFFIPAYDAVRWISDSYVDPYVRTYDNLQRQLFSNSQPEVVTHTLNQARFEKVAGTFRVSIPASLAGVTATASAGEGALIDTLSTMIRRHWLDAKITGFVTKEGLIQLTEKTTLQQFVGFMESNARPVFESAESDVTTKRVRGAK